MEDLRGSTNYIHILLRYIVSIGERYFRNEHSVINGTQKSANLILNRIKQDYVLKEY